MVEELGDAEELNDMEESEIINEQEIVDWTRSKDKKIWWKTYNYLDSDVKENYYIGGLMTFSFDTRNEFNLFTDYPQKLNEEEIKIFELEESDLAHKYRH